MWIFIFKKEGTYMGLKRSKLVIVGVGHVGSAVLNCALSFNLAAEIALIDIIQDKAHGEALDSNHATPFPYNTNIYVHAGGFEECRNADVIIIAAGPSVLPGEKLDRLTLADRNVKVMKDVMGNITSYTKDAVIIMITNPLDITTYYAANYFDYPKGKLFGTGTSLETARFKRLLADKYRVDPKSVQGFMLGEHGNSAFAAWSLLNIGGIRADQLDLHFQPEKPLNREQLAADVVNVAYDVLMKKGWTNSGIAMAACRLAKAVLWDEHSVMPVSTTLDGEFGLRDVALSLPCIVAGNGIERRIQPPLSDDEIAKFAHSGECVKAVLHSVGLQ